MKKYLKQFDNVSFTADNISVEEALYLYKMVSEKEILSHYNFPAHPSGDGIYRIWVKDSSKKTGRRQLSSKTLDELKNKVLAFEKCSIKPNSKKSFREIFEFVENEKLELTKGNKLVSRKNTVSIDRSNFNRFFENAPFVDKMIDDISKAEIERYTKQLLQEQEVLYKAYSRYKGILRAVFTKAKKKGLIENNIFYDLEFELFEGLLAESAPIEERIHPEEEFLAILKCAREYQKLYPSNMKGYALELQMIMSRRIGEITVLKRSDITDRHISLNKYQTYVREPGNNHWDIREVTKNKRGTLFPRFGELNNILDKIYATLEKYYPESEYLFPTDNPDLELGIITNKGVYQLYVDFCKELGIELSRKKMKGTHSFRRNGSTDIVNKTNGNMQIENYLLGHTAGVALQNYYVGPAYDDMVKALEKRNFH